MKKSIGLSSAALVLAALAGFIAGKITDEGVSRAELSEDPSVPLGLGVTRSDARSRPSTSAGSAASQRQKSGNSVGGSVPSGRRFALMESIVRGENVLDRNRAWLRYIDQLAPDEFEAAVEHFRGLGITGTRMGEYALLLSAWAKQDPLNAMAYARANTATRFATDTILTTWATDDPLAAIQWAESNHDGDAANPHMAGIIKGIAPSDPDLASRLLIEMPRSRERGEALDAILPYVLEKGVADARQWIESITDDSLRNGAMMRAAEKFAESDPAGTVDWLIQNPSEATQRRMDDVYRVWMRNLPQDALAALSTMPKGEIRTDALRGVVSAVSSTDPVLAIRLMDQHAADVDDGVVGNFIWRAFDADPAAAADQIQRLENTNQQERSYRWLLDRWLSRDPAAATEWINRNPLPENIIRHLNKGREENQSP